MLDIDRAVGGHPGQVESVLGGEIGLNVLARQVGVDVEVDQRHLDIPVGQLQLGARGRAKCWISLRNSTAEAGTMKGHSSPVG